MSDSSRSIAYISAKCKHYADNFHKLEFSTAIYETINSIIAKRPLSALMALI